MSLSKSLAIVLAGLTLIALFFIMVAPNFVSPGDSLVDSFMKGITVGTLSIPFILPIILIIVALVGVSSR